MSTTKSTATAAALAAAGALVVGGAALANAATVTPTPTPSSGSTQTQQNDQQSQQDGGRRGPGGKGGHTHTAASAAEKTAVTKAVTAKDSTITVTSVQKDADGSFDARGTKAGAQVMVEVSKDYTTVEVRTGGPGGGKGGGGMHRGTPVDAVTLTKIKAAVTAKDSAVTVERAMQAEDGSYRAMGTKAGARVMVEVSSDLKTVSVKTDPGRGGKGGGTHTAASAAETTAVKAAVKAKDSAVTVSRVTKDADGSFDAFGTKSGERVRVEVSKDYKTVTVQTGGPRGDRGQGGPQRNQQGQQNQQAPTTSPSAVPSTSGAAA